MKPIRNLLICLFFSTLFYTSSCTYNYDHDCDCNNTTETCFDGIQNQNETGIDCGGCCAPCKETIDTLVLFLKPDSTAGKDAVVHSLEWFTAGDHQYMWAAAWTWEGGNIGDMRSLFEFNLDTIPQYSTILSAKLSLFGKKNSPDQHSTLSGSNESYLLRITTNWDENTVNWSKQPETTFDHALILAPSKTPSQDYLNIDVTALVQDMIDYPEESFGFMMRLATEIEYRMMTFASSDNENSDYWPEIEIYYLK